MTRLNNNNVSILIQKLIAGVLKHFAGQTLPLGSAQVKVDDLEKMFDTYLGQLGAAEAAHAAWIAAVKIARQNNATAIQPMLVNLRRYLEGVFGVDGSALTDFGLAPRKPVQRTVEEKAATVEKSLATRVARGTKGARQKAGIHGTVASTAPSTAAVAPNPELNPKH